jgi:hypothetical protein
MMFAVVAVLTTPVLAQETNTQEITYLTFSNNVELPGVTLPAGTYTFRLADTPSRNVVQVLDRDQKKVMGQWLFVQAERPDPVQDTMIMFKENREGATPAVQYWFFPGERIGKEFIYPKDQAQKIADRTGQKVRTEEGYATASNSTAGNNDVASNSTPSSTVASNESSQSNASNSTINNAPAPAAPSAAAGSVTENRGFEGQTAQRQDNDRDVASTPSVGTSGSANNQAVGTSGRAAAQLPKTGSELPLAGLIGLISLAGALGTRAVASVRQ